MSSELIRAALAERAEDVSGHGPDLPGLHARVAATRRRRQTGVAIAASTVLVAMVLVTVVAFREDDPAPQPAPQPSPSVTSTVLPFREEAVEVLPPPDARESASRARLVMSMRNESGVPTLTGVVEVDEERLADQKVCTGSEGTWLVVLALGFRETMHCFSKGWQEADTHTTPFNLASTSSPYEPGARHRVRMFVTTTSPRGASRAELEAGIPKSTPATFGLDIWGQSSPTIATLVGHEVSVLGEGRGRDWWFTQGIEAPTGAESLTFELPASSVDRMVQTVARYRPDGRGMPPYVQVWVDGRKVDHRFDEPSIAFLDETTAYLPAGGPHTVALRVTRGKPANVDFAAAVFEADE